ncbi:MAG: diacylglycerol/lipid kinase family protein [Actinomycetota bacterium]
MGSPFGPLVLIVNPRAGRGRVGRALPEIERRLHAGRLAYRIATTQAAGDAARLARQALEKGERFVVAVGGDGTVHEVVNGMIEDDRLVVDDAVLGVLAAGSGCDFVRTFGMPDRPRNAVRHLLGSGTYQIDVVRVGYANNGETRTRYSPNIAEAGLGAEAVRRAEGLSRRLGRGRYFVGFWLAVAGFRPAEVHVETDRRTFDGQANNVIVANCQYYGGGMRISPRSYPGDGLLDVQISVGPKSEAFTTLPKIYRGQHVPSPTIKEYRARDVRIDADRALPVEADGEVLGTTPATFTVLPQILALKI